MLEGMISQKGNLDIVVHELVLFSSNAVLCYINMFLKKKVHIVMRKKQYNNIKINL